jgi:D-beta-D-heptose 7-phosphate kinase/D-beta-D-heptose 1-phosphate adenosyltransferase
MSQPSAPVSPERLKAHIDAMRGVPVLVVGDIMLDRFVYGNVERISPESPVPVLAIRREDKMLGGAGNALANLAGLGAHGIILSVIGDDESGAAIKDKAQSLGLTTEGLIVDAQRPTIVKTRFLAGHQQLLRTDFEKNEPIGQDVAAQLLSKAKALLPSVKALIVSDYGKGLLSRDVIAALITMARAVGVPVIVDPKGHDYTIYSGASLITPNKKELAEGTHGMKVGSDSEVIAAAQHLIAECNIDAVLATRSAEGMSLIQKTAEPLHLRGSDIEVFDVSGAGDTVIATISAALAAGADLRDAACLANLAGGIVVTKVGTAPIRAAELRGAIDSDAGDAQNAAASRSATIQDRTRRALVCADWDEAAEQVRRWKARGLKTGFTNGCFDILHFGHVSYLNEARDRCDRLIVGLNSDASVKILKGEGRPIHDETSRAAVLAALGSVDLVVIFGAQEAAQDNTASALIALLQPDVYFKGGDYTQDQIPEAPVVKSYGGSVDVMPVYEGHSTTSSLAKSSG